MKHDWLNLIEVSGPFLALPILDDVFPQGLEGLDTPRAQRLRRAHDEWREAVDADDAALDLLHGAWIDEVLTALEMDGSALRRGGAVSDRLRVALPEHGVTLAPDLAVVDSIHDDAPLLLMHVLDPDTDLSATRRFKGLATTPAERMVTLLRGAGCPVGLVTNGEQWMLVHAPVGSVASYAIWHARLWAQEPETLRAFVSLLGVRRFFGPESERLPALYERSLKHQDDVTDALGEQVRRAVEVLVQAVDRADQDRDRALLRDTEPRVLYEAALTVMMRLVFLLAAEERGLLLLNDERYDAYYALSTLRMQLRAESDEILERRRSGWSRLLALFRAVYGGIEHPALRLPALGGSLFDPDRYPFLEGRTTGTIWRMHPAEPLPIDDRTVLLLLEAIQTFEGRTLSYRALDVEQIGHVYEGLLERTVKRVDDITLELDAPADAKDPRVTLGEVESAALDGRLRVEHLLTSRSQRSPSAIRNGLDRVQDERLSVRLLTVCRGDVGLRNRILPYACLLRVDPWGYPIVQHAGAFVVVLGADRRESGTHYTPKNLTEKIVVETLAPLVYRGPAEGEPRQAWELKRPHELLSLKVCDPAMGSGAFLVQTCRFIADRLVEAWSQEEARGHAIEIDGRVVDTAGQSMTDPLPTDTEERTVVARRLVAERCLYGVDLNPLAVELAKLSLWLTTLSKGRPFGFLDHNLKSGDSLVGLSSLEQLTQLSLTPATDAQLRLFGQTIDGMVQEVLELRQRLREIPIRDISDVEAMASLHSEAVDILALPQAIADAFIGVVRTAEGERVLRNRLDALAVEVDSVILNGGSSRLSLKQRSQIDLAAGTPGGPVRPFHWPLEFPEIFLGPGAGFSAVLGNPPWASYSGRQAVSISAEDSRLYSRCFRLFAGWKALHSLFVERALGIVSSAGSIGLLVPAQVADLEGYGLVRSILRDQMKVAEPLPYFGEGAFSGVVQPTCSIIAHRSSPSQQEENRDRPFVLTSELDDSSTAPEGGRFYPPHSSSGSPGPLGFASVLLRLESFPTASPDVFADPGIHTGNCSKEIIVNRCTGRCAPVREGKNVFPYRITKATKMVRLDYEPSEGEYFTVRDLAHYAAFPILLRQTAPRPICALHKEPTYFRNSVLACRGLAGTPHEAVVAWLNSTAVGYFHMKKTREANQKAFPQVKIKHLRALPVPTWTDQLLDQCTTLSSNASNGELGAIGALDLIISRGYGLTVEEHEYMTAELQRILDG